MTTDALPPDRPVPGKLKATALYAVLTFVLMYPVSVRPGSVAPGDGPDTQLGVWMLAWDVHAFTHQPLRIFDANTFYPLPRTLAYQDNLIGSALIAAPVMWLTGNPILGLNVVSLVACVLCGLGGYMLGRRLGMSTPAALLCGFIFAFCPARFFRYSQIGLAPVQWIPLTLASLHAYLDGGGRRQLWFALGFFTLQTLTSGHAAVFLVVAVLTVLAYRFALGERILLWQRIRDFGLPGVLLIMPAILSYLPYRMNQVEQGLRRGIGSWGNPLRSFLASPTHFHMYLISLMGLGDINKGAYGFLFMGYLPTLLALTTAVMLLVRRTRRVDQSARPALLVPIVQLGLIVAALWWAVRLYAVFAHAATTADAALGSMVAPALATGGVGPALLLAYRSRGQAVPRSGRAALVGAGFGRADVRADRSAAARGAGRQRHARALLHERGMVRVSSDDRRRSATVGGGVHGPLDRRPTAVVQRPLDRLHYRRPGRDLRVRHHVGRWDAPHDQWPAGGEQRRIPLAGHAVGNHSAAGRIAPLRARLRAVWRPVRSGMDVGR